MAIHIRRREFIAMVGGGAAAWPLAARAQQRPRRIGVLMGTVETAPDARGLNEVLDQLKGLGWTDGTTARIDVRWSHSDLALMRQNAETLLAAAPDVILCHSNPALAQLKPLAGNTPIVFVMIADPVGSGFVQSMAHPGSNMTGFTHFEPQMGGKWVQMLKEMAPKIVRIAILMHPETAAHVAFAREGEEAGGRLGILASATPVHDAAEIEQAVATLASRPHSGLVILPHTVTEVNRDFIITLAARFGLPSISAFASHPMAGALASYGVDTVEHFRPAAGYIDRILRGAKPADLPVQATIKFRLVINLKTAKALGIDIPPTLLAIADEVIE
jgi:putative tryptophan/tyrosine transport system substrate-binding protein